ncbi:oxidoreductase [Klebsiella pneumoniae]|nr:oxidoreductase [Klebsiella pneumoniae]
MVGSEVYCGALKHMGGGQIHSLNMLLGSAQAAHSLGVKIFESSPVVEVNYGKQVRVRRDGQRQSRQTAVGLRQLPQQYGAGDLQQDAGHLLLPGVDRAALR